VGLSERLQATKHGRLPIKATFEWEFPHGASQYLFCSRTPCQGERTWCQGESASGCTEDDEQPAMQAPGNFTQLLTDWRDGNPKALERLTPLVYEELRRLARNYMRSERASHTLQATAVVHEAFLRLIQANVELQDRAHFFALASRLMRRVLVDHAKSRGRLKRGGPATREPVPEDTAPPVAGFDVIALDEALESLQRMEPRLAQVIELHYFGGLTYDQIAVAAGASAATVHRNIRLARAWLLQEIAGYSPA
jgi:RNA polymerase sigma factor (TIGR02999 family)